MAYTLGIDIGTYETKGVLVDEAGVSQAHASRSRPICMCQNLIWSHSYCLDWYVWDGIAFGPIHLGLDRCVCVRI